MAGQSLWTTLAIEYFCNNTTISIILKKSQCWLTAYYETLHASRVSNDLKTHEWIVLCATRALKILRGNYRKSRRSRRRTRKFQSHSEGFNQPSALQAAILHSGVQRSRTSRCATSVRTNATTVAIAATHHGSYDGSPEPPARNPRVANILADETGRGQGPPVGEVRHGITRPLRLTIPTQNITNVEPRAPTNPASPQATTMKTKAKTNTIALTLTTIALHLTPSSLGLDVPVNTTTSNPPNFNN